LRIIRELLSKQPAGNATDIAAACVYLRNVLKKRSICFIISDFYSTSQYETALSILGQRHDCIGIHVWDKTERQLPDLGIIEVQDPENKQRFWADTTNPDVRKKYTQHFDQHKKQVEGIFQKAGCDLISLRTDLDYTNTLLQLFEKRNK
jgi:uncharacterized protein (DUF58 family)